MNVVFNICKEKALPTMLWFLWIFTITRWWQYESAKTCCKYDNYMIFIVFYYSGHVISTNLAKKGTTAPELYGKIILKYVSNILL